MTTINRFPVHTVTPALAVDWRGQRSCGVDLTLHYPPDWHVETIEKSNQPYYEWLVSGSLPFSTDPQFKRFTWMLRDGFWNDPRYELSKAVYVERQPDC